ncbi:hypothetical protein HJC23_005885 [Cyclotella cryptica]|uniref:protein-tyrosine sulfotransferase n=1 Tax=Cyclotella cryptica TaxID=29204 RepID=A0ABD3R1U2_9STRA|eukprot:CCRYP_000426-RA/>CCRYP_000426-RA protein AED:0.02 eAED:0.02 QI:175/1/1/1/1/1/2/191/771
MAVSPSIRPPPQARPCADENIHPVNNGHSSLPTSAPNYDSYPRPSTWPVFLIHFVLPITLLLVLSNSDEIYNGFKSYSVIGGTMKSSPLAPRAQHVVEPAPSSLPSKPSSASPYQLEVDAAIERRKNRKGPKTPTMPSSREHSTKHTKTNKNPTPSRRTSPQSTDLYRTMEANIVTLRSQYQASLDTPHEIIAAIRYADYLKQRDATIHDGGTYQMEAIQVYWRAVELLENRWRVEMLNGVNTRAIREEREREDGGSDVEEVKEEFGKDGLHRELFLDYDDKSTEGLLCAAYTSLGKVYFMSNMFERAVESYEKCLSYDAAYLDALSYRGQANIILGRYAESGRDYVRVLQLDTERIFVDAFTGLSKVLSAKEDVVEGGWDSLIQVLDVELPRHTSAYEGAKAANNEIGMKHFADSLKRMHHAMFQYHDVKTKDAPEAWAHLHKGNEYKMSTVAPFNHEFEKQRVQAVKHVFVKNFFPEGIGSQTRTPIFIIGFVRSGSTLLERILDAHPLIVGTGEDSVFNGRLDYIRNEIVAASQEGALSILHNTVKKLADDVVADMIERWEIIDANSRSVDPDQDEDTETKKEEGEKPIRFADKMLTNYMNVGFIHLLFPNALILHVAREPMDTIFSAYKHDFPPGGLDYTSEFKGLAQLYHSYRDVMEHWDTVLPGRVTHIRYEDMVTDLPNVAPKIIEAAGVPWDPTVLDFHKKKHAVNTLSTTQVRKGVYSHHLKGWKRYETFLGELIGLVGDRINYDLKTTLPGYVKSANKDNP